MRVLISAYACEPGAGSEAGHGWNYPSELAKRGHQVHVVIPARWREGVQKELTAAPIDNLTFHFVGEREGPMRLGWTVGSALRYFLWQWDASQAALEADRAFEFDVVHHVSYGTLLGGSFMWRLGKPFVFGPAGGGQTAPPAFLSYFGSFRRSETLRTLVVRWLWPLDWPAIRSVRSAAIVLASNRETSALARRMGASRVESLLDVYLPDKVIPSQPRTREPHGMVRVLWVGRMLGRKGLQLTVEALNLVPASLPVELEVVGDGPTEVEVRAWLGALNLIHPVSLAGRMPWDDVHRAYEDADIFVLTSLRDTVGIQLLEAMAHALPVITLDHQGAADLVPEDAGVKVPVSSPSATRRGIADAITKLAASADLRASMGAAGHARAQDFALSRRMIDIEDVYASATRSLPAVTATDDDYVAANVAQSESESDDFSPERYRQFARHLPRAGRRVLDLGCNVGRGGEALKSVRPDLEIVGVDLVEERLRKLPQAVYASWVEASATSLPFEDATFDAVLAGEFVEHLTEHDVDAMLNEARRVLRRGGRLLLTTPNPQGINFRLKRMSVLGGAHFSQHPPAQLRARLQRHGYKRIRLSGSGRMTRHLGECAHPLMLYGSYLAVADA